MYKKSIGVLDQVKSIFSPDKYKILSWLKFLVLIYGRKTYQERTNLLKIIEILQKYQIELANFQISRSASRNIGKTKFNVKRTAHGPEGNFLVTKKTPDYLATRVLKRPFLSQKDLQILTSRQFYNSKELNLVQELLWQVSETTYRIEHQNRKIYVNKAFYRQLESCPRKQQNKYKLALFLEVLIGLNGAFSLAKPALIEYLRKNDQIFIAAYENLKNQFFKRLF